MLVPGKHALLLCMSVITNWKPGLISMKKSDVPMCASAGGARFQYALLKPWCPRRSALSKTPLSVVKTVTYLRAFRGGGGRVGEGGMTQNQARE